MTKTLSMISYKSYSPNVDEGFVIFSTSTLISCLIDGLTLKMKSQSNAYLLNESEHDYWILDIEDEVHSIWVIFWTSGLQEHKDNFIFRSRMEQAIVFSRNL